MARVKAIWGPFPQKAFEQKMEWRFNVLFEEGTLRAYRLVFYFRTRNFFARAFEQGTNAASTAHVMSERGLSDLPEVKRAEVIEGKVTDILRARLSPEQLAAATAAAIRWSMK